MTTPRDDIAGLIERLRKWNDEWPHWKFTEHQRDALRLVLDHSEEAAATIDALQARVKELERDLVLWSFQSLKKHEREEGWRDRATRLQQERDEAIAALRPLSQLEVPKRPQGNAGAYSIRHSEIETARDLVRRLAGPEKEGE